MPTTGAGRGASTGTGGAPAVAGPLARLLMLHEGWRAKPYLDTTGHWSIGFGRNLTDVGISYEEGVLLLEHDLVAASEALYRIAPWAIDLDEVRRAVLTDMAFNMGPTVLAGFARTLAAVRAGDYDSAAALMVQSKWARQVGTRAVRLADMMRSGAWPPELDRPTRAKE